VLERRIGEPMGGIGRVEIAGDGDLRAIPGHAVLMSARERITPPG
jgi:hypothetical protein